jgi:hypothetical protein
MNTDDLDARNQYEYHKKKRSYSIPEDKGMTGELRERDVCEWLARRWEDFVRVRFGGGIRGPRVIDRETRRIKPKFSRAFARVLAYASANKLEPLDTYFTLLGEGMRTLRVQRVATNLLGGTFYNELVEKGRTMRLEQFSGREDRETLSYRAVRREAPRESSDALESECRKFRTLREQYAHFTPGRFWLFFLGEFSGTFLHASDDYRDSGLDLLLHLNPVQIKEWTSLDGDPRLAASTKRTALALLSEESYASRDHQSNAPSAIAVPQRTRGSRR